MVQYTIIQLLEVSHQFGNWWFVKENRLCISETFKFNPGNINSGIKYTLLTITVFPVFAGSISRLLLLIVWRCGTSVGLQCNHSTSEHLENAV